MSNTIDGNNTISNADVWTANDVGVIAYLTAAQLTALAAAGELTPYATYVASDIGEEFSAPDEYTLVPKVARVLCSLPAFGGTWDHTTDATAAIQAAADYAALFEPPRGIELPPEACIKNSVFIPSRVFVYGHNYEEGRVETVIRPHASASLSTGFMFNFNTTNGTTPVEAVANGARTQCGLFGVMLYGHPGTDPAGMRLALVAGTTRIRDVRGSYITQLVKKIDGQYIDNISIENVSCAKSFDNSEYMIEFGTGGNDAISLKNLNFPNVLPVEKAIKVYLANGCEIAGCINGGIYIERSNGVTISNYHCEVGSIISESSNLTIDAPYFTLHSDSTDYPISTTSVYSSTATYSLHVKDAIFIYGDVGAHEAEAIEAEINTVSQYVLEVTNCKRFIRMSGSTSQQGIRLRKAGTDVDQWNKNSFYLSQHGTYDGKFCHGHLDAVLGATMSGITWSSANANWGASDLVNGTTYYYKSQLLLEVATLVGVNQSTAEESQAVTTGQRVGLPFSTGANTTNMGMIRVYRGTTTNSYNFYADIPAINVSYLVDQGTFINGVAWVARGAGAVDALTGGVGNYRVTPTGGADAL